MSSDGRTFHSVISHLYFDYFLNLRPSLACNLQKGKGHICFDPFLSSMSSMGWHRVDAQKILGE